MSLSTSNASDAERVPAADAAARRRRGRIQAVLVLLVCAAPVIAAYIAFYFFPPAGRVNYGELIEARPLPSATLTTPDGKPFSLGELKGKWVMVQFDDGRCDEPCQAKLYTMRQTRTAQGREMDRIERVWLQLDDASAPAAIAALTEGVRLARVGATGFAQNFPAPHDVRDHVYLVDPLGNLMLRYPKDADPSRIIKDLQRLLKVSRIG